MKRLLFALVALAFVSALMMAQVQTNIGEPQCVTQAAGDSSAACASTAFVQQTVSTLSVAGKSVYVSTSGNDSNSGFSPFYPKLTIQAAVNAAASAGVVYVGSGTYTLSGTLAMQPGVRVLCNDGAIITQGNAANLTTLVDFNANSAAGASIERCTIDGNRSNNTDSNSVVLVSLFNNGNDVTVRQNIIQNSPGYAIQVGSALRPNIIDNRISNFYSSGIACVANSASIATHARIEGNRIDATAGGVFPIQLYDCDYSLIRGNTIIGTAIGLPSAPLHVTTSGTSLTWVSGPQFTQSMHGQTIIINGLSQNSIATVNSATSLTLTNSAGTVTNQLAGIGTDDMISVVDSSFSVISNNNLSGNNSTYGIALSVPHFTESMRKNIVSGNYIAGTGSSCISVAWATGGSGSVVDGISLTSNIATDCAQFGSFNSAGVFAAAINVLGSAGANTTNVWVDGNLIRDDQGSPTIVNWLAVSGEALGSVFVGHNTYAGVTTNGILGDVTGITLAAGWGSTASTSAILSQGNAVQFTITSSGTGQAANPSILINKIVGKAEAPPVIKCFYVGGTGVLQPLYGEGTSTAGQWVANYNGTPASGSTYIINCL